MGERQMSFPTNGAKQDVVLPPVQTHPLPRPWNDSFPAPGVLRLSGSLFRPGHYLCPPNFPLHARQNCLGSCAARGQGGGGALAFLVSWASGPVDRPIHPPLRSDQCLSVPPLAPMLFPITALHALP